MKINFTLIIFLSLFALCAENEVPAQFRIWGKKAPLRWGAQSPVLNKHRMESIAIPKGMKYVLPETNLIEPQIEDRFKEIGYLPFVFNPMRYVYNVTRPHVSEIDLPVRTIGTPGEYVSLAFAIRSLRPLNCVEVELSPFKNKKGETGIPLRNQELRRIIDLPVGGKTPGTYTIIPRFMETFDEFDILNIPKNHTERFWLTVKIPDNAAPGIFSGTITVSARNGGTYKFRSAIRILPFKLVELDPNKDMLYVISAMLNDSRLNTWGRNYEPTQLKRMLADMKEHGFNAAPTRYTVAKLLPGKDGKFTADYEQKVPLDYYCMNDFMHMVCRNNFQAVCYYASLHWGENNEKIQTFARSLKEQKEKRQWPEFYCNLGDEPGTHPDRIKKGITLGKGIKKAAPEIQTMAYFNGEWFGTKDWHIMRDYTDILCSNFVNQNTIKQGAADGYRKLWLYNGIEFCDSDTRSERLFFGFVPWKYQAKGVSQYMYMDFAHRFPKEYVLFTAYDQMKGRALYDFVYPSESGPLPTQKWETIRKGIYDYRYLLTLSRMAKEKNSSRAQAVIDDLMKNFYLDYLTQKRAEYAKNYSPETLDAYRWKVTQAILELLKEGK